MHDFVLYEGNVLSPDDPLVRTMQTQIRHFRSANCRAVELTEGVMLRYTPLPSLYFYLRSGVKDGKIQTNIYASDTPYERHKTAIGQVRTAMFDSQADYEHLKNIESM